MDWKDWIGKKVFIRTKHNKVFSGKVKSVDSTDSLLTLIYLIDKFGLSVMVVSAEIVEIKEEA